MVQHNNNVVNANSTLLKARHSFNMYNEQSGFSKDTVILPESVGATDLGLEGRRALAEAPYKTPSQVRFFFFNNVTIKLLQQGY